MACFSKMKNNKQIITKLPDSFNLHCRRVKYLRLEGLLNTFLFRRPCKPTCSLATTYCIVRHTDNNYSLPKMCSVRVGKVKIVDVIFASKKSTVWYREFVNLFCWIFIPFTGHLSPKCIILTSYIFSHVGISKLAQTQIFVWNWKKNISPLA